MRIAVTGIGIISAAGKGVGNTLATLRSERSGIVSQSSHLNTCHQLPVGEVTESNASLRACLGLEGVYSRTALLGMTAAAEALADVETECPNTALVSATSVGGMDLTERFFEEFGTDDRRGRLRLAAHHDCADSTLSIARYCSIDGFTTTLSTACSSAANALMTAARLLHYGMADRVIAGGTDALCRFTLNGFRALQILDTKPCRPFDASRAGLNLGEGAAYLVLERAEEASRKPYCYLSGFANANDAYHQTASSPDGEGDFLSMQRAIATANLRPEDIDYVNVHGTGTPNNDLAEGIAMRRLFGGRMPLFSSTKAVTGHTLAAAGAVEAVFSALMLHYGEVYPNLRFKDADPQTNLIPLTRYCRMPLRNVLSNSFGFGGNCASLLFTNAE